jgi:mutator protein MutT
MPIHVVAAVVERDAYFLICQRALDKRHGGLWEFPGGKLNTGETHADAARRELTEELGVEVRTVGAVRSSRSDPESEFVIDFVDVEVEGAPEVREHQALAWVSSEEMSSYEMPPTDRAFAELLRSQGI